MIELKVVIVDVLVVVNTCRGRGTFGNLKHLGDHEVTSTSTTTATLITITLKD